MNNQKEIYEALLAGEKITQYDWDKDEYIQLFNGMVVDENQKDFTDDFKGCGEWQIYKESKWCENILECGVLCRVKNDSNDEETLATIKEQGVNNGYYDMGNNHWIHAKPLTKQEIQVFMDNAPEDKSC